MVLSDSTSSFRYRKIPGDVCEGGFEPAGEKLKNLNEKCKGYNQNMVQTQMKEKYVKVGKHVPVLMVANTFRTMLILTVFHALKYLVRQYDGIKR